jgi:lysophospholipase L1-like esterase
VQPAAVATSVLAVILALGGCGGARDDADIGSYVALGDSFTSGGGLPRTIPEAGACGQSELSYPHLVAKTLGAELTDASCGGATTDNGTRPQTLAAGAEPWPPQLDALTAGTDLVTVGLGGNDLGWYLGVMASCTSAAVQDPTGDPCERTGTAAATDITAVPPQIGARLETLLTEVHRGAPHARLLLVGYPQPVPAKGSCPELPLATGDYPFVRAQWQALDDAMRKAAAASGATFVEVMGPSEGHDICAGDDAWVNGVQAVPGVAAAYHPLAREQVAVAGLVEQALRS